MSRGILAFRLLCFGGGGAFVFAAILQGSGSMPGTAVLLHLLAAVLLMLGGALGVGILREERQRLREDRARTQMLQAELDQQRSSIDILADGLNVAIFVCEPKANVRYANRKAVELFEFENPVGRTILAVTLSYDLEQLVLEAFRTGEPQAAEVAFTYPAERVGLVDVWTEGESAPRAYVSIREITELRRLERIRQDFVANVSHELRTPLTSIRAMAETLQDGGPEAEQLQAKYFGRIIDEVDRLSLIANDLLILSAAESNPVRKQACDIAEVVQACVTQLERKATKKELRLTYSGPTHLLIEANTTQMTQVFLNLVDNAINYTPAGAVEVSLQQEGEQAVVRVRDSGIGISSEHVPRIFERFYRVDKGRSRATGGTGLGLSIVKHIVEAHGGTVSVESALNQGSEFTVALPLGDLSEAAVSEA